jgi:hypothetical protein
MKDLHELTESEKLDLFKVEELEDRLEMGLWGGSDPDPSGPSCPIGCEPEPYEPGPFDCDPAVDPDC